MGIKVGKTLLYKFFARETTPGEADAIASWLGEDPSNRETFDREYSLFMASQMSLDENSVEKIRKGRSRKLRTILYAASIAAALLCGIFLGRHFLSPQSARSMDSSMLMSKAEPGLRTSITLSDGTVITLNSGATLQYPETFRGKERRVRLAGEAMFDVARDESHPFIVETYAYNIKVLGTKFDVLAYSDENQFTTSLLEGRVAIQDTTGKDVTTLESGTRVDLRDGRLVRSRIESTDDYLWTDGIVSVGGLPFDQMMKKLGRAYGVNISLECKQMPQVRFEYLKFRISDGIEQALDVLKKGCDFTWEYDKTTNTYHIK